MQSSFLGEEIDVATSGGVACTLGRFEEWTIHFWCSESVLYTFREAFIFDFSQLRKIEDNCARPWMTGSSHCKG